MLEFGNKEFRNLEEQVLKNQQDIKDLQSGIKISYWTASTSDLGPLTKEENYGKYIAVGTTSPKTLYVITHRANEGLIAEPLGQWPLKGDKGDKGLKGDTGEKGNTGDRGIQGIQGIQGPVGHPGDGWNSLNEIDSASYEPSVVDKVVETSADLNLSTGDSKVINLKYDLPIEGSEYISVDENVSNNALVVELDETELEKTLPESGSYKLITSGAVASALSEVETELSTKLDATKNAISSVGGLVTPTTSPNEKEIVGLNNNGSQIRIKIGSNLSLAGSTSPYTLNATGGGGGDTGIFVVDYGVTPFIDIYAAIGNEKLPVIYKDTYIYRAVTYTSSIITFEAIETTTGELHIIKVDYTNFWTSETSRGNGTIFVVDYGSTLFNDIRTAIGEGKLPIIYENNYIYIASINNANIVIFETLDTSSGALYTIEVTSANVWTTGSKTIGTKWYKHNMTLSFNVDDPNYPIQTFSIVIRDNFSFAYNNISSLISYKRSQIGGTVYNNTIAFEEASARSRDGNGLLECIKAHGDNLYAVETNISMLNNTATNQQYFPRLITEISDVVTAI